MQKTLVIIKPDGLERGLVGKIISKYEGEKLNIDYCRLLKADEEILTKHYFEHREKPFFGELLEFMSRGDIIVLVLEGKNAIARVRKLNEDIRVEFETTMTENLVHASDSVESAEREIELWVGEV